MYLCALQAPSAVVKDSGGDMRDGDRTVASAAWCIFLRMTWPQTALVFDVALLGPRRVEALSQVRSRRAGGNAEADDILASLPEKAEQNHKKKKTKTQGIAVLS